MAIFFRKTRAKHKRIWREGYAAGVAGAHHIDNPYRGKGFFAFDAWGQGWSEATKTEIQRWLDNQWKAGL